MADGGEFANSRMVTDDGGDLLTSEPEVLRYPDDRGIGIYVAVTISARSAADDASLV